MTRVPRMGKRSGEAQAALGRHAGPMRHRLAGRGGARNDQRDIIDEMVSADGYQMPYQDSDTLTEACPEGCRHTGREDDCQIPILGFDPEECPYLGDECTSVVRTPNGLRHDHSECQRRWEEDRARRQKEDQEWADLDFDPWDD